MKRLLVAALVLVGAGGILNSRAAADGRKADAVRQERKKYEGTWRVTFLQVDGKQADENDAKKIIVVNRADGTWTIRVDGKDISTGASTIDPTATPRAIDFTPSDGPDRDRKFLGIYEIRDKDRKLCFAPAGKSRPADFASRPGTGHILVIFQREAP